jgi:hypothetical protein
MRRKRALKVVLVLLGLAFSAGIYPVATSVRDGWQANKEDALPMMLSLRLRPSSQSSGYRQSAQPGMTN